MACKVLWESLLKVLNFLLAITGLAMVGYGLYLLIEWTKISSGGGGGGGDDDNDPISPDPMSPVSGDAEFLKLGRPMLAAVALSNDLFDKLPKAWFIYLFIGVGVIIFVISFFGCIGAFARNRCCLSCYSFLVILLILVELAVAAIIFFDSNWKDVIPADKTGTFDMIYHFLKENWNIAKWVTLGAVILEALIFLLALLVIAANKPASYDSDEEYIAPRSGIRQPLIHQQAAPVTGAPVPTLDQRPSRNDTWSQRMREKYGLDTSLFTYNPTGGSRGQQDTSPPAEKRSHCTIL
ncbi:tobamovirus multiplication protein 2A-like [Ananas comosus]|uniref:Tobamovirus multiplication protein 2A-like n=1 Tax=Ananas comosus TaxID=4615 RepID=A0A6P5ET90_ANACO|nr:tobamovirus multiplication protein 2A-like [Ananas comosus]